MCTALDNFQDARTGTSLSLLPPASAYRAKCPCAKCAFTGGPGSLGEGRLLSPEEPWVLAGSLGPNECRWTILSLPQLRASLGSFCTSQPWCLHCFSSCCVFEGNLHCIQGTFTKIRCPCDVYCRNWKPTFYCCVRGVCKFARPINTCRKIREKMSLTEQLGQLAMPVARCGNSFAPICRVSVLHMKAHTYAH